MAPPAPLPQKPGQANTPAKPNSNKRGTRGGKNKKKLKAENASQRPAEAPQHPQNPQPRAVSDVEKLPKETIGSKRKEPPTGDSGRKRQRYLTHAQRESIRLEKSMTHVEVARVLLEQYENRPRGGDLPEGLAGNWNRKQDLLLVISPVDNVLLNDPSQPSEVQFVTGWKMKFLLNTNAPAIRIFKDDYEFIIRGIFSEGTYPAATNRAGFATAFSQVHRITGLKMNQVEDLFSFGQTPVTGENRGIKCLSFQTSGDFWLEKAPKNPDLMELSTVKDFLHCFSSKDHNLIIVRRAQEVSDDIDRYWQRRTGLAVCKGVWSFYNGKAGKRIGQLFQKWKDTPFAKLEHQDWMQIVRWKKYHRGIRQYASHAIKNSFGSMRELEVVHSVAVIMEGLYEQSIVSRFFDWHITHKAHVIVNNGGYVQLDITVRRSDNYTMPAVNIGQKVKLRYFGPVAVQGDSHMPSTNGLDDSDNPGENGGGVHQGTATNMVTGFKGEEWNARILPISSEGDFIVGAYIKVDPTTKFTPGTHVNIGLKMDLNPIPIQRQLTAVCCLCGPLSQLTVNSSRTPNIRQEAQDRRRLIKKAFYQNFLLGKGNSEYEEGMPSVMDVASARMSDTEKEVLQNYMQATNLNNEQQHAVNNVFQGREIVTQIQGMYGTGKTKTVAAIMMKFAQIKVRSALCAPSKVAVEANLRKVISDYEILKAISPEVAGSFKIIYVPGSACTKSDLATIEPDEYDTFARDMLSEIDASIKGEFGKYTLWTHIIQSFTSTATNRSEGYEQAEEWLGFYDILRSGGRLTEANTRKFVETGILRGQNVFTDFQVQIVASTSYNTTQLIDLKFRPRGLIIIDGARATASDGLMPLSMGARFNILVGDYRQLQPAARSAGFNEFANQHGRSLFMRFVDHPSLPTTRLNPNYKMQPDMAQIPAELTYDFLAGPPSPMEESSECIT